MTTHLRSYIYNDFIQRPLIQVDNYFCYYFLPFPSYNRSAADYFDRIWYASGILALNESIRIVSSSPDLNILDFLDRFVNNNHRK